MVQRQGSLVGVGAVVRRIREVEGERARWENQEAVEVGLQYLEGNQEAAAAAVGCGGVMIWMLPRHIISGYRALSGYNLHVLPGGGPSGMGISSSVSSSSSSLDIPGGGPSGMGISSSVFSAYTRINRQASILE